MLGSAGSHNSQLCQLCWHLLQIGFPAGLLFPTLAPTHYRPACLLPYYSPHGHISSEGPLPYNQAAGQKPAYKLHSCLLFSFSDLMAISLMPPPSFLPVQGSRHSSSLTTRSMAQTLSHGFCIYYRPARLLPTLLAFMADQPVSLPAFSLNSDLELPT